MEGKARHWRHSHARVKTTCGVVEPLFFNRDRTMKLSNQVAIVTGAGRNIGEEISKTLAAEGAKVALVDLDKGRGDRVAAEITKAGGEAAAFVADVAAETDIARVVAAVVARWGRIDILINNAAISDNKNILDITKDQWDKVLAVTLTGPFLMSQHAARAMVAGKRGGKIVNVGSTSGFFGRSRAVAYAAAKGGIANLTRAMAVQLAPHNIRVNGVVPNKIGSPVGKDEFDPTRPVVNLRGRHGLALDVLDGVAKFVARGVRPADIDFFAHGTTITTNALLEMRGAKVGLLITQGYRAVQEVQNQARDGNLFNYFYSKPAAIAPQHLTKEIPERCDYAGRVLRPLDKDAVRRAARELKDAGVESIAVCYLFSFMNPAHEQDTRALIHEEFPAVHVSL